MENQKYILDSSDLNNLSEEQRRDYFNFFNPIWNKGIIERYFLEKFVKILYQQYSEGALKSDGVSDIFNRIIAENFSSILDRVTSVRNYAVTCTIIDEIQFKKINEGLEALKKSAEHYLQLDRFRSSQLKNEILPRIEQLKSQISLDIQHHKNYSAEKIDALSNYRKKRESYDRLSFFGKLVARLNGKKKELEEARIKASYYNNNHTLSSPQPGEIINQSQIINPSQYAEYLENIESELSNGGMKR